MHVLSNIRSLMAFNRRVLEQGTPGNPMGINDINQLSELLFFNVVFGSNMDEMFQKYDMTKFMDEYVEMCQQRTRNINAIIHRFNMIAGDAVIVNADTFENRILFEKYRSSMEWEVVGWNDESLRQPIQNVMYHVAGDQDDKMMNVMAIYPPAAIYDAPLSANLNGRAFYWKTDFVIRSANAHGTPIMTFRVTRSNDRKSGFKITKVEYTGDPGLMQKIRSNFPDDALVISNPYLYTDDLVAIINTKVQKKETIQRCNPINLQDIFRRDQLIEYPYHSFDEYIHLLQVAANSSAVSDIYVTLYRVGSDPTIFYVLRQAVMNGIRVHVSIELFASGEDINKMWYHEMKAAGMDVITYQPGKIKVHCKLTLIQFHDGHMIAQVGTGNYHTKTTSQYTDLSFITARPELCSEIFKVFRVLKGKENQKFTSNVLVTRFNARDQLAKLINAERKKGPDGYIAFKCNALDDEEIIKHLEKAADAGCQMDLIIRGICTWLPEQINKGVTIRSIVWDKLEHSRVYAFGRVDPTLYIGSLDLVQHKLDNRIETLIRLQDPDVVLHLVEYLNRYIVNTKNSWIQTELGVYHKESLT